MRIFFVFMKNQDCSKSSDGYFKPSIGTNGRFCVCTQPTADVQYYSASESDLIRINSANNNNNNDISKISSNNQKTSKTSENNIIRLYQADFSTGTYRITEPGTYIIMEDIEFDFNAPMSHDDYLTLLATNPQTNEYWYPRSGQNHEDEYPGAQFSRDAYHLGFFAGITIESDDVILDLNGYELRQSDLFYFQQRWFSVIECGSSMFMPGTGPGFFGHAPKFATNTIIKNGIIGLSSHFGIHGNDNVNLILEDLIVRNFETHGIQFNGFDNIEMNNIEVGPTTSQNYMRGEYGHARIVLQRLKQIANEYPDDTIEFYGSGKATTAQDIADELEYQMNLAFWYVNYYYLKNKDIVELFENGKLNADELFDEHDESWQSAKEYFINHSGLPLGGVLHGIYLNVASNTVSFLTVYKLYTPYHSSTARLNNIKIHGLRHEMNEWVRLSPVDYPAEVFMNPFGGPIDGEAVLGGITSDKNEIVDGLKYNGARLDSDDSVVYYGNIMTNAYLALNKLSNDNWGLIGVSLIGNDRLVNWAEGNDNLENVLFGCNSDPMKHAGKGIIGLRMQGVEDILISDLNVNDFIDSTPLGRLDCADYDAWDQSRGGGNFRQLKPMQIGFSGNMIQGVNLNTVSNVEFQNNIEISDLTSNYGDVIGLAIWPANEDVKFSNSESNQLNINIDGLVAGNEITVDYNQINAHSRPNSAPQACGIIMYEEYNTRGVEYSSNVEYGEDIDPYAQIITSCVSGHLSCQMSPFLNENTAMYTMIGGYNSDTSKCSDEFMSNYNKMNDERQEMEMNMKESDKKRIEKNTPQQQQQLQQQNNKRFNKENENGGVVISGKSKNKKHATFFDSDLIINEWSLIVICIIIAGMSIYLSMDCIRKRLLENAIKELDGEHSRLNQTDTTIRMRYGSA